jgi:hypothetical protein
MRGGLLRSKLLVNKIYPRNAVLLHPDGFNLLAKLIDETNYGVSNEGKKVALDLLVWSSCL